MAANEKTLGDLHDKVARVLSDALDGDELPEVIDEDSGEVTAPAKRLAPSAAIIAAATKFLKDNNITCVPTEDNALGELQRKMEERRNKRIRLSEADIMDAKSQAGFLGGLPN